MTLYLPVTYPRRCSQCSHWHDIHSDNELLHHMKFHGIRNLIKHWDKEDKSK
jgi:hypothetical protein